MMRHRWAFWPHVGVVLAALTGPRSVAHAYEEQASLEASSGYIGAASADTLSSHGTALELGGGYGLSDLFVLRGGLGYAPRFSGGSIQHAGRFRAELAYIVDIVRWVPFFGGGAALWAYDSEDDVAVRPAVHVVLGIDFLASRAWIFGVDARSGLLWESDGVASLNEVQARLSHMFELF